MIALALFLALGMAQRSPEAEALLSEARASAEEARRVHAGSVFSVDQALWRGAINSAKRALELAPDDPDITLFLARTYSAVNWHIRAWEQWTAYLDAGGRLTAEDEELLLGAGTQLGFAAYEAGSSETALSYYEELAERLPGNPESLTWLGRLHFEAGEPEAALPYWTRLLDLEPGNEGAAYYLALTEEQLRVGPQASAAFQRGLNAYESGALDAALSAFEDAFAANDSFAQAYMWAGRTSLELGQPAKAERYWQRVLELSPDDERARYFAERAENEVRYGPEAARALYEGQDLYREDELDAALSRFEAALAVNPAYPDALAWSARALQELGRTDEAEAAWKRVTELDPDNEQAAYFVRVAEEERRYGGKLERTFALGVRAFQSADLSEAERLFKEVIGAKPQDAQTWAWLGRVYFTQAQYAQAQAAYEQALSLEPGNSDYRFFADEAALLAADAPADGSSNDAGGAPVESAPPAAPGGGN